MINKKMKVGEAVKLNDAIIPILDENKIDYCCGGESLLEDLIEEKNLGQDFIERLNQAKHKEKTSLEEAITYGKKDLIDYLIENHHADELDMLDKIDKGLIKLLRAHYDSHGEELREIYEVFSQMKKNLELHFIEEEVKDFPAFIARGEINLEGLREEHEIVGASLKELERLTNDYRAPADGCNTYRETFRLMKALQEDIHKHVFLENSVLFKMEEN